MTCFDVGDKFSIRSVPSQQKKVIFQTFYPSSLDLVPARSPGWKICRYNVFLTSVYLEDITIYQISN